MAQGMSATLTTPMEMVVASPAFTTSTMAGTAGMEDCFGYFPREGIEWPISNRSSIDFCYSGPTAGTPMKYNQLMSPGMPSRCGILTQRNEQEPRKDIWDWRQRISAVRTTSTKKEGDHTR